MMLDMFDADRFLKSMIVFNTVKQIGSIYELSFQVDFKPAKKDKLVDIIAYCLNPNHFHLMLKQSRNGGISKFMQKLAAGYSWYFNHKYKRNGVLFQGPFKIKHINDNSYALHTSAYINLNDKVHQLGASGAKLVRSSWDEYRNSKNEICKKDIILNQFNNPVEYTSFALESLKDMIAKRDDYRELAALFKE